MAEHQPTATPSPVTPATVREFSELFEGRTDAYGTEQGGCEWVGKEEWILADAGNSLWERHLNGTTVVGVYPLASGLSGDTFFVKWGCVDFDEGFDVSWPDAANLRAALGAFGITGWIERSRSKGYHVWVFASEWIDAQVMRSALIAACQLVDAPIKEVNPKQVTLAEGKIGNYVRLPYPGFARSLYQTNNGLNQVIIDGQLAVPQNTHLPFEFTKAALASRCTAAELLPLAARAVEKKRTTTGDGPPPPSELDPAVARKLLGLAWTICEHGPLDGGDRSSALFKLARLLWEGGTVTMDEAWQVMCDADRRWGKFLERDEPDRLWATLEKAWSQT